MANILTDLAPDLYKAADVVGRSLVGVIPSAMVNADGSERAAVGQPVRSFFTRKATSVSVVPSMTIPEGEDQTVDNKSLVITKSEGHQIPWTGEDQLYVNSGNGFETVLGDQIQQAMESLTSQIEIDLAVEGAKNASRAIGTAGITPFASDFKEIAELRKILVDNGMPTDQRSTVVFDTTAGVNMRSLAGLVKANEAGSDILLRSGELLNLQGMMIKESNQMRSRAAGTGTGYLVNGTPAVGNTVIPVDTGSGTILQGDVITFAGDTNQYVVAAALSGGNVTIAAPGLIIAPANDAVITVASNAVPNLAFHQSALEVAMRAPAVPKGGDAAIESMLVQDQWSGLVFEVSVYKGYKKVMIEVAAAWGVKAWKPEFISVLLG